MNVSTAPGSPSALAVLAPRLKLVELKGRSLTPAQPGAVIAAAPAGPGCKIYNVRVCCSGLPRPAPEYIYAF